MKTPVSHRLKIEVSWAGNHQRIKEWAWEREIGLTTYKEIWTMTLDKNQWYEFQKLDFVVVR